MGICKKVSTQPLENALKTLMDAMSPPPRNDRERDGAIQRFEFTFELSWKTIRRCLVALGRSGVSGSPMPVLRDGANEGLIHDVNKWFEFLDARNTSTHVYNAQEAERIYKIAETFTPYVEALLVELRKRLP